MADGGPVRRLIALCAALVPITATALVGPRGPTNPVLLRCAAGTPCTDETALLSAAGATGELRGLHEERDGSVTLFGQGGSLLRWSNEKAAPSIKSLPSIPGAPEVTALWDSPDGSQHWAGDARGVLHRSKPDGSWVEVIHLVSGATGAERGVSAGWASATGIMWVTAGDTAHLLRWSGDGKVSEVGAIVDTISTVAEVSLVGVNGLDESPSRWDAVFVDDAGRMMLIDSDHPIGPRSELPLFATTYKGKPDIRGEDQLYRSLQRVDTPGQPPEFWATAWYGRLRRLLMAGPDAVARQCGNGRHGCLIEPSLLPLNDLGDGGKRPRAIRTQLSLSNANGAVRAPDGKLWVVGDDSLVAHRSEAGAWQAVKTLLPAASRFNLQQAWSANDGVWVLGEEVCRGRNQRPTDGVAKLEDFHRSGDPDYTNAFRCSILALCPRQTTAPCGGIVAVPAGVFPVSETLAIDNEIQLAGQGAASVIEWHGQGPNEYGGMKVVFDLRGRPRGVCPVAECPQNLVFPPGPGEFLNAGHVRTSASLRDLTIRAGKDSCSTGGAARTNAIGIDLHSGYEALSSSSHSILLANLKVCGFEAGLRLAGTALDGTVRRVHLVNNHVGLDVEIANQWNLEDIDAEANDLGILLNEGELFFHGLRLAGNKTGGMLVTRGWPVIDSVTARDNVHGVSGFDLAVVSGRHLDQWDMVNLDAGRRTKVEPHFRQASRRLNITLSNLALLGGDHGEAGRLLLVNPVGDGGRCGVGQFTLRNVAGPIPPVLDVLDECPSTTETLLENAPVALRRFSIPEDEETLRDHAAPLTALIPGYAWAASRSPKPAAGSMGATADGPALALSDRGNLRVGGFVKPDEKARPPAKLTLSAPAPTSSRGQLWAVGSGGLLLHFDGLNWEKATTSWRGQSQLRSVWSNSTGQDIWAVGEGGVILHGSEKAPFALLTSAENLAAGGDALPATDLNGLWGVDSKHVWAVGEAGVILRWDGTAWHRVKSDTQASLKAVHGYVRSMGRTCSIDVWAVGTGNTALHATESCNEKGTATQGFSVAPFQLPDGTRDLVAVLAPDDQDVFLASNGGRLLQATQDQKTHAWTVIEVGGSASLGKDTPDSLWGTNTLEGSSALVIAGTPSGEFLHYDPRGHFAGYVTEAPALAHPVIWGTGPSDIWVAGQTVALGPLSAHWDGRVWTTVPLPASVLALAGIPAKVSATPAALDLVASPDKSGDFGSSLALTTKDGTARMSAQHVAGGTTDLVVSFESREVLRVTGAGDVGLGTRAPAARLDVRGDVQVSGAVSGAPILLPQTEVRCGVGSVGRLILLRTGLVRCGADGQSHSVSR